MKVLITGSSGLGKTTVIHELAHRGFTAYDSDDVEGLSRLELQSTGEPVAWPKGYVDWSVYTWNWQEPILKKLLASSETVFLGGINGNQPDYYHLFDVLIVLTLSAEEHERRLRIRPPRTAGDGEMNIQDRLDKNPILLQRFLDAGALAVDAHGTPADVADRVLKAVQL